MGAMSKLQDMAANNGAAASVEADNNNRPSQLSPSLNASKSNVDIVISADTISSDGPNSSSSSSLASSPVVALTASGKPKEKRRNNEKRKERSRDAARCRRSRETEIFSELGDALPLQKDDVQQLDKASIMRIAIAYLKIRDMMDMFPNIQKFCGDLNMIQNDRDKEDPPTTFKDIDSEEDSLPQSLSKQNAKELTGEETKHPTSNESKNIDNISVESALWLKQTLDGFLLILSNEGDITYVTDNISDYLGVSKIDMLGQQIWEYAHQCDHAELKEALNLKRNGVTEKVKDENLLEDGISTDHRDLFVRLKCTLTSRGRSINIKSASYKVIHITGHLVVNSKGDRVLVAMGRPIPHPSNIEIPMGSSTFLTKHSLDMKFIYVDDKMFDLLGYKPNDLLDTSLFNYHHGCDSDSLMVTFKSVLTKGQGETCRYRFLGKYGGYCWVVTQATVVYDKLKPQSVVCVNYVISNLEKNNEIYTLQQYEESQKHKETAETTCDSQNNCSKSNDNNNNNNSESAKKNEILLVEQKDHIAVKTKQQEEAEAKAISELSQHTETKIEPQLAVSCNQKNNLKNLKVAAQPINDRVPINSLQIKCEKSLTPTPTPTPACTPIPTATTSTAIANASDLCGSNNKSHNNAFSTAASIATITSSTVYQQTTLLPHCPTTTVTRTIFEQKSTPVAAPPSSAATIKTATTAIFEQQQQQQQLKPTKFADDKGPKTVTLSILRPAPVLPSYVTNIPTTTSTQSILQTLQPLNVAPGAQSVTASLFVQRSQLLPSTTATATIFGKQQTVATPTATAIATATATPTSTSSQQQQQQTQSENQQDMNKGYLTFVEDATELAMLKEEPDDLTAHLVAPNAVDACLPLDESTPLFNEMLVGLIGSYGSLLPDDINSLDSSTSSSTAEHSTTPSSSKHCTSSAAYSLGSSSSSAASATATAQQHRQSSPSSPLTVASCGANTSLACSPLSGSNSNSLVTNNTVNSANIDPFINNAHDESNDTLCSQHLLSPPSVTSKSPEGSSLPSLCSPNSLSQEDEFSYYTMNVDDMDDLTMRAPYIPMNEQDDLPLLTSDDFMWSSGNAFTADDFSLHTKDSDNLQALQINQSINYNQQQQQQQQQQHQQQQQFTQHQQQFSNSLCSSPASTVSSMSPSPTQQHQQQHSSQHLFPSDSSELAALLCGTGNGSLSLLQDPSALQLNGANTCGNNNAGGSMLSDDLEANSSTSSNSLSHHQQQLQQQQFQQQCLQQLQDQLQQHHRQQQQQQLLSGLNINCKKEKFDTSSTTPVSLTPSLCDSIEDSFDNVYTKNSTNLDCWSDFLQINTTTDNSAESPQSQAPQQHHATPTATVMTLENLRSEDCKQHLQMQLQQQQQLQQNIILNAVPLITIQSNNKNLLTSNSPSQPQTNSSIATTTTAVVQQQTQSNSRVVNKINTIKLAPVTSTATIRIIENKQPLMQHQHQKAYIQQMGGNGNANRNGLHVAVGPNKRHLANNAGTHMLNGEIKRIKSNNMDSQLLQQLINSPKNGVNSLQHQAKDSKCAVAKWSTSIGECKAINGTQMKLIGQQQQQQHQLQQQSNSVLKNLLISGCDLPCLTKSEEHNEETDSLEQCVLPFMTSAMRCETLSPTLSPPSSPPALSANDFLLSYNNNPLICGPRELLSPTLTNDDSNPPGLTPYDGTLDSTNDSGIDDTIVAENMSPLKRSHEQKLSGSIKEFLPTTFKNAQYQNKENENGPAVVETTMSNLYADEDDGATMSKRKRSISYMDSSNPLMTTPFLMELCNDNYDMNTKEYLEETGIDNVLSVWPTELA